MGDDARMTYDIHLDDKYGYSKLIDVKAEAAVHEPWFNQTLTTVNDSVIRTRAPGRTVVLMVESRGVVPTGD